MGGILEYADNLRIDRSPHCDEIKKAIKFSHDHGVRVAIGNPIMDQALSAGSQATRDVIDYAARLGLDIMEISVIARTIDDEDLADLLDYVNGKGRH